MAGGTPLDNLVDIFRTTGPAIVTGPEAVINEAQLRTFLLKRIVKSNDMLTMIQGGESIRDLIYLDELSSFADYQPNEEFSPQNPQVATQWSAPWRFSKVDVSFYKQELGLNMGQLNRGARHHMFKRLIRMKMQNMWTSLCNGMERQLFATPNATTMEATGGKTPYSLFATLHQFGAVSTDVKPTATVAPGFTTVQQINPTTAIKWRNPVEFYSDGVVTAGDWTGFRAFKRMYNRLRFEELVYHPEMGDAYDPRGFIMVSNAGDELYESNVRAKNDQLRGGGPSQPDYPGINYRGAPIVYVEQMDFAVVWPSGAGATFAPEFDASVSESGGALADPDFQGPRFVWIVPEFYTKVVHADHFLEEEPVTPPFQPFSRIIYYDCWHQNICRSRQRAGGVVAPSADVVLGP